MQIDLSVYDTSLDRPQSEPSAAVINQVPDLVIKHTKTGRHIVTCSVDPAPQSILDEALSYGLPVFTHVEISKLAGAPDALIGTIIDAKLLWPAARIESYLPETV